MSSENQNIQSTVQIRSILFACLLVLGFGGVSATHAQWTSSSGNTTTTDKVGIGTTSPGTNLVISATSPAIDLIETVQPANSKIFQMVAGSTHLFFRASNDAHNSFTMALGMARNGGIEIGSGYVASYTPPADGAIIQGNVGIGTTNPGNKLEVVSNSVLKFFTSGGNATLQGNDVGNTYLQFNNTSSTGNRAFVVSAGVQGVTNDGLSIYDTVAGATRFVLNNSGYVGVGTTGPGFKLDVQGGQVNASGGLCIAGDCKTGWSQVGGSQWANNGSGINYSSGNVGIGNVSSPSVPLHVVGNTILYGNNGYFTTKIGATASGDSYVYLGSLSGVPAIQGNNNAFSSPQNLSLQSQGGNVGIGSTTPNFKLQVLSSAGAQNIFQAGQTGVSNGYTIISDGTNLTHQWYSSGSEAMRLNPSGNVGIGTSTPGQKLDILGGNINVTSSGGVGGNITISGTINAKYQDVAEWVPSSEQLSAGTVVVLDSTKANQVTSSSVSYDTRVAGVVSEQPGIALGEKSESKVLVATTGRVRVKVDATKAPIHIGDLLVTSDIPGVAMKSEPMEINGRKFHQPGTLIGKAQEPLEKGKGTILVLLSLQ